MNIERLVTIFLFFLFFATLFFWAGRKCKNSWNVRYLSVISLILSFPTLVFFFEFIIPHVPSHVKGGFFGAAGALVFGSVLCNVALGASILGRFWAKPKDQNFDSVPAEGNTRWPDNFPWWFNRASHLLNGSCIGSFLAVLLFVVLTGRPLSSATGHLFGMVIAVTVIYCVNLTCYLLTRWISISKRKYR